MITVTTVYRITQWCSISRYSVAIPNTQRLQVDEAQSQVLTISSLNVGFTGFEFTKHRDWSAHTDGSHRRREPAYVELAGAVPTTG